MRLETLGHPLSKIVIYPFGHEERAGLSTLVRDSDSISVRDQLLMPEMEREEEEESRDLDV